MSVPVLSWSLIASRTTRPPRRRYSLGPSTHVAVRVHPELGEDLTVKRSRRAKASKSRAAARLTRPLEPILFPKLRIYFADFPYLHCSMGQRLLTLETCCGYEYERTRKSISSPGIFKGHSEAHRKLYKKRVELYQSRGPYLLA